MVTEEKRKDTTTIYVIYAETQLLRLPLSGFPKKKVAVGLLVFQCLKPGAPAVRAGASPAAGHGGRTPAAPRKPAGCLAVSSDGAALRGHRGSKRGAAAATFSSPPLPGRVAAARIPLDGAAEPHQPLLLSLRVSAPGAKTASSKGLYSLLGRGSKRMQLQKSLLENRHVFQTLIDRRYAVSSFNLVGININLYGRMSIAAKESIWSHHQQDVWKTLLVSL